MHTYIERELTSTITSKLKANPVVAILGPRQCGKSTLAKAILKDLKNTLFLDLERSSDLNKLRDPELFFASNKDKLICLDEIQRLPEIFSVLRAIVDSNDRYGQFLMLGSASPNLIKQSSETLAGRISYVELTPFLFGEISNKSKSSKNSLQTLWIRGGFPRSLLAKTNLQSYEWRLDFIRNFLERDIPNLGLKIAPQKIHRFWRMFAHSSGQVINKQKIGSSLGISSHTVTDYTDILEQTYMLRTLPPFIKNLKKRIIKSPKVYIRDTGILHSLMEIETMNDLFSHPIFGQSWESFVVEQILSSIKNLSSYFYRNSNGNEIDLILEKKNKLIAVEIKGSSSPEVTKGFYIAIEELKINDAWIIAPVNDKYQISELINVSPLTEFISYLKTL
ncbi:MAG: ATP-binding protein [Candidatus Omnitrophota bacterium]